MFLTAVVVANCWSQEESFEPADVPETKDSLEIIQTVSAAQRTLYAIPAAGSIVSGTYNMGETKLIVQEVDDKIKFEAVLVNGETIEQWVADNDLYARFVFNPEKQTFERLNDSVRVELDDYDYLDQLVEDTDATSGKAFPQLGYAVIRLPKSVHPAKYVEIVRDRDGVRSAAVEVEQPLNFPH